ncbi:hypothetical protein NRB_22160 [Novosphingobium sp. 11B]
MALAELTVAEELVGWPPSPDEHAQRCRFVSSSYRWRRQSATAILALAGKNRVLREALEQILQGNHQLHRL